MFLTRGRLQKDDWKTNSEKYLENKQYVEVLYFETDSIPNWLDKYENLETIGRFETRKINYIPSSISNLKKLKRLVLAEAKLDSLPKFIGNITSLEKISIHDNNLQNLPNTIGNLSHLDSLFVSDNKINKLPESFGNLKKLVHLDISHNKLSSLPKSFNELMIAGDDLKKLKDELTKMNISFYINSPTNQQFPILPDDVLDKLREKYSFAYQARVDETHSAVRFCTCWATKEENVEASITFNHCIIRLIIEYL